MPTRAPTLFLILYTACTPLPPEEASEQGSSRKRIFVTSASWTGDLRNIAQQETGLTSGDHLCHQAAQAGNLRGTYRAWLSTAEEDAIDRVEDVGPWYPPGGTEPLFNNKAHLAGVPLLPLTITEHKHELDPQEQHCVWTGTQTGGVFDNDCTEWEATSGWAIAGDPSVVENWTRGSDVDCYRRCRLYCLGQ